MGTSHLNVLPKQTRSYLMSPRYQLSLCVLLAVLAAPALYAQHHHAAGQVDFSIRSVRDGKWSDVKTWEPSRVPGKDDRVLVRRGTSVEYDVESKEVIRLIQVVGTLEFARDRDTELNVGILTVQHREECS